MDKLQKVGKLAGELLTQGIARDSQEALQKAEQILSKEQEIPGNKPFEEKKEATETEPSQPPSPAPEPQAQQEAPVQQKPAITAAPTPVAAPTPKPEPAIDYTMIIQKLTEGLTNHRDEIAGLKTTVATLQEEIKKLKQGPPLKQVLQQPKEPEPQETKQAEQKPAETPAQSENNQTQLATEEKKANPRSGMWEPGDISIEKIFYSGPKKD